MDIEEGRAPQPASGFGQGFVREAGVGGGGGRGHAHEEARCGWGEASGGVRSGSAAPVEPSLPSLSVCRMHAQCRIAHARGGRSTGAPEMIQDSSAHGISQAGGQGTAGAVPGHVL